jgi:pimeloyl-ACP methyl ester carboxylesterase
VSEVITARRDGFSLPLRVSGHGIPMIFLHGLGSDSADSARDLGELPGIRLALADQRGHGASRPAVGPGQFAVDDLAGDLAAMIAELGWDQPVIGGGSMGAAVALRWALRDPGALRESAGCRALVLVAPALGRRGPESPGAAAFLADAAARIESDGLARAVAGLRAQAPGGGDGMAPWLRQDGASLAVAMRAAAGWQVLGDLSDLAALPMPVAVVGIEGDPLHPAGLARRMHAAVPGSSLQVLPSLAAATRPGAIGAAVRRGLADLGILTTQP